MASEHCKVSPSSRHRWTREACPGSVALIDRLGVKSAPSEYANEGTTAHWVAAQSLINGLKPSNYLGITHPETGVVVTQDMINAVDMYVTFVNSCDGLLHIEAQMSMVHPVVWGTPDLVIDDRFNRLVVVDYKHGEGVGVDVEDNLQLQTYAVLAANEIDPDLNWETVELAVVQPRYNGHEPIQTKVYPIAIIEEWHKDLVLDIEATRDPAAPLRPSVDACRWCPAKEQCPARDAVVVQATQTIGLPPVPTLSRDKLRWLMQYAPVIKDYLKEVHAYASNMAARGDVLDGYKLVWSKGHRKWVDEEAVVRACKRNKLKIDEYRPRQLVSPAEADKLLGKDVVNNLCTRPQTLTLAPESDKRPEVMPSIIAQSDLAPVPGGE